LIVELLLTLVKSLVLATLSIIPVLSVPAGLLGSVAGFIELLVEASIFLPVEVIILCIGWFIALYNLNFITSIVNWVIRKIPTIS
jgi:putative Mn2+ efflux pump MntP